MIRLMMIHPRPTRGGFSAVISQAAELLALGGFEISVMVEDGGRVSELPCGVERIILNHPLKTARGALQARRAISRLSPDILHLHGRQAGFVGRIVASRRKAGKIIYTPHGTPWVGASLRRSLSIEFSEWLLLRRTHSVLCVSRSEQADWTRRDPSRRIVFMPNLIEDTYRPSVTSTAAEDFVDTVLVPGGYNPQKRLEVVLEALAMTPTPRRQVVFCGSIDDPNYQQRIAELARSLGVEPQVRLMGNIADIRAAMESADLVVLPSFSEGFPIVGQEAVTAGANVLWSAIPAHQELFGDTGKSFWTSSELAELMMSPSTESSVVARQAWFEQFQNDARSRRATFWTGNVATL